MNLDDNTRSGLQFLTLGAVLVLVLVLLDRWLSGQFGVLAPEHAALGPFHHGYLLGDGVEVVDAHTSRGERIAWALVIASAAATMIGALVYVLTKKRNVTVAAVRLVLFVCTGWGIHAALFKPARMFFLRDTLVVQWRHTELVADLPLPFTRTITLHGGAIDTRTNPASGNQCGSIELFLRDTAELRLSSIAVRSEDCQHALDDATRTSMAAAALINKYLHP